MDAFLCVLSPAKISSIRIHTCSLSLSLYLSLRLSLYLSLSVSLSLFLSLCRIGLICCESPRMPELSGAADGHQWVYGSPRGSSADRAHIRSASYNRPAQTSTDQQRPAQTGTDRQRPAQTSTDRHRPAKTSTDRHRPAQTGKDQHRPAQTGTDKDQHRPAQTSTSGPEDIHDWSHPVQQHHHSHPFWSGLRITDRAWSLNATNAWFNILSS